MHVVILEPFFTGSHKSWAQGLQKYSGHNITILCLKGRFWKWRMFGGAVSLCEKLKNHHEPIDLFLASDMLNVPLFRSLCPEKFKETPLALYMHENQITYPWSNNDPDKNSERQLQYAFINYTSALNSDLVFFNSLFHKEAFLTALPGLIDSFPDETFHSHVEEIAQKSQVLHLGIDLCKLEGKRSSEAHKIPLILWNHRWEYDKNPNSFFNIIYALDALDIPFQIAVLGESFKESPPVFEEAKTRLKHRILHWGYLESKQDYAHVLHQADIIPVTSNQDFFGISAIEAIYCGVTPLLPRRLAFPEHVADSKWFYTDDNDLFEKLKDWLTEGIPTPDLKQQLARYDWQHIIKQYDEAFASLVSNS